VEESGEGFQDFKGRRRWKPSPLVTVKFRPRWI
jgi:hypothetical protein